MFDPSHAVANASNLLLPLPIVKPQYGYTDVALSGLCDWAKIHKLLSIERQLRMFCNGHGPLDRIVSNLDNIEDKVIGLRVIRNPGVPSPARWLRQHCANDFAIAEVKNMVSKLHDYVLLKNYNFFTKLPIQWRNTIKDLLDNLQKTSQEIPYTGHSEPLESPLFAPRYQAGDPRSPYFEKVGF